MRHYVTGLQCEYCLKHYAHTTDLLNHVEYSRLCWSFYRERGVRVDIEPGVNSKKANLQRQLLKDPFVQAEGPQCMVMLLSAEGNSEAEQAYCDAWISCMEQHTTDDSLLEGLRRVRPSHFLYHDEMLQVFRRWTDQLVEAETLTLSRLRVLMLFQEFASGEWFLGPSNGFSVSKESVDAFFQREAQFLHRIRPSLTRRVAYSPRIFAHLFSGARREADFEYFVEQMNAKAVSVDIIYDLHWGNTLREETFALFARALREGALRGFLAGPPCETWSRARAVASEANGVRPLRSRQQSAGLPCLNKKESLQVSTGNLLLGGHFEALPYRAVVWIYGCGGTSSRAG